MQTGGQRCRCSNTLASGSKHKVCSHNSQQMAVFNYFHHSVVSLSSSPTLSHSLHLFHFYPFFLQVLRNRGFHSSLFSTKSKSLRHLVLFCIIREIEAILWCRDVLIYVDPWIELCQREFGIRVQQIQTWQSDPSAHVRLDNNDFLSSTCPQKQDETASRPVPYPSLVVSSQLLYTCSYLT